MKLKAVSGIMLTLLLTGMLTLAFNIQTVKAEPTTIIVPNDYEKIQWAIGNASDEDTIFVRSGTYYEHVVVDKSISLVGENCSNTVLNGNGTDIVVLIFAENVGISGFTIQNGEEGISLIAAIGATEPMVGNISNNIITSNKYGISAVFSHNNTITDNIIQNNSRGISLVACLGTVLRRNDLAYNDQNLQVGDYFVQDIDTTNTVDGKPIYYWVNQRDKQVPANAGYVAAVNSVNITVENLNLRNNFEGVLFAYTTNSTIKNVNVSNCNYGIALYSSNYNTIVGNIMSNGEEGIRLQASNNNVIVNNAMKNNTGYKYHAGGVHLIYGSHGNIISRNTILNNYCGIRLTNCDGNIVYHNNLVNNTYQVLWQPPELYNIWDNGYPSGGNYWSDYNGTDIYSGPYQNETGSDGIGDTAYVVDGNNRDNYPLMYPWSAPSPPSYNLTIYSSPTGITFTVDGVSRTTPWSGTYTEDASVSLVMPETHDGYVWNHWQEDGDTNRTKTVTMNTNITLTGVFTPVPPIATVDIDPDTLNLKSKGRWITCYIELPKGYDVSDIDRATILLNDTIPVDPFWIDKPLESVIGDYDNDTLRDLMVKFSRKAVSEFILSKGIMYGNATLTITGELYDGSLFEGGDVIKVGMPSNVNSDDDECVDIYDIAIPEFPTWTSILLILIMLTVAIAIYKRRLLKKSIH